MSVENDVKKLVQQEYKSLKAFSEKIGLPYTTVDSIFKRGFSNSSVSNMIKISNELNLDVEALNQGIIKNKANSDIDEQKVKEQFAELNPKYQEYVLKQIQDLLKMQEEE